MDRPNRWKWFKWAAVLLPIVLGVIWIFLSPSHAALIRQAQGIEIGQRLADVRNLMADIGLLQVDYRRADDRVADHITDTIIRIVQAAAAQGPSRAANSPAPNLADAALAGIKRFPLAIDPVRR